MIVVSHVRYTIDVHLCRNSTLFLHQTNLMLCRFREIVAKLKSMAQALRPPPKRRPSQIATQASAASSVASSHAPSSQLNSNQLPNILECAVLAEKKTPPIPSVIDPAAEASADSATIGGGAAAAAVAAESASEPESPQVTLGSSVEQEHAKPAADKPQKTSSDGYVSPFGQAQQPAAATAPQIDTPFANIS